MTLFPKQSFKKNFIIALIFLVLLILGLNYGKSCIVLINLYTNYKGKPFAEVSLKPRQVNNIQAHYQFSYKRYGYQISAPWGEKPQIIDTDSMSTVVWLHQQLMVVRNPTQKMKSMYQFLASSNEESKRDLFNTILSKKFNSEYEYLKSAFNSNITALFPSKENVTLLLFQMNDKQFYLSRGEYTSEDLYAFELDHLKGFQLGDPSKMKLISLFLFFPSGESIEIEIMGNDLEKVKQSDIDYIIQTIQKI